MHPLPSFYLTPKKKVIDVDVDVDVEVEITITSQVHFYIIHRHLDLDLGLGLIACLHFPATCLERYPVCRRLLLNTLLA